MNEFSEKIQEAIKSHLPETVAGEMKEFITRAEETERELEARKKQKKLDNEKIDRNECDIKSLQSELKKAQDQIKICEDCRNRYNELTYKEHELNVFTQCADSRINDMKELVSLAFKSPVFKRTTTKNETVPVCVNDNGYTSVDYHHKDTTETTETSEE